MHFMFRRIRVQLLSINQRRRVTFIPADSDEVSGYLKMISSSATLISRVSFPTVCWNENEWSGLTVKKTRQRQTDEKRGMGKTLQSKVNGYKYSGLDEGRQETGEFNRREREREDVWICGGSKVDSDVARLKRSLYFYVAFIINSLTRGKNVNWYHYHDEFDYNSVFFRLWHILVVLQQIKGAVA